MLLCDCKLDSTSINFRLCMIVYKLEASDQIIQNRCMDV